MRVSYTPGQVDGLFLLKIQVLEHEVNMKRSSCSCNNKSMTI